MGPSRASEVYAYPFGAYYSALSVYELIALLGPQSTADWLRYRKLFRWDGPLRRNGLINLDAKPNEADPSGFVTADVSLAIKGFALITGETSDVDNDGKESDK